MRPYVIAPLLLALLGAGCAAPREHYYTLLGAEAVPAPRTGLPARVIVVEPAVLPEAENRAQLVVEVAAHQQQILEQERWIQPLGEDLQRAVASRLAATVTDAEVLLAGDRAAGATARHLYVEVRRFDLSLERGARLEAHWVILAGGKTVVQEGDFAREAAVAAHSYAALVGAQAALVRGLADALAAVFNRTGQDPS